MLIKLGFLDILNAIMKRKTVLGLDPHVVEHEVYSLMTYADLLGIDTIEIHDLTYIFEACNQEHIPKVLNLMNSIISTAKEFEQVIDEFIDFNSI